MAVEPELADHQLPDGAYIRLNETVYFAQDRLGSSDLIKLHRFREGWWWQSRHNPHRVNEQTDAQNYGSALHKIMLEGVHAYESAYLIEPDKRRFPQLLETVDQIKAALNRAGVALSGTSKWKLADWADAAELHLSGVPCWPNIVKDFQATREILNAAGEVVGLMPAVSPAEDVMLRLMLDVALRSPDVRNVLGADNDWPSLSELTYFWTDPTGVRRRARFDKPLPATTMDLKTLGDWRGRPLEHSIGDRILKDGLDIQVGDQHDARRRMFEQIRTEGEACIHGGSDQERDWLIAMAQRNYPWDWTWLFYQKPELSGKAPMIFPLRDPWRGPFHQSGYRKARRAIDFYNDSVEEFGLGSMSNIEGEPSRPWGRAMPTYFTDERVEAAPHITLPHYGWDEVPVDDEEDHFRRD